MEHYKKKVELNLAVPTVKGIAALCKQLSGEEMSAEGLAKLRAALGPEPEPER